MKLVYIVNQGITENIKTSGSSYRGKWSNECQLKGNRGTVTLPQKKEPSNEK